MARLPLVSQPADEITEGVFAGFDREGRAPIDLYRVLANSPKMLRAYSTLARALRYEAETPRSLRELVILRVAKLTGSDYEWTHHRKMAAAAGVTDAQVRDLGRWQESDAFGASERAALRCADEMQERALSDQAVAELRSELGDSGAVEIVLLVAFYQALATMIQALGLEIEPEYRAFLDESG